MSGFTARIARIVAAAAAAGAITSGLVAAAPPAHALDHFTVDRDAVSFSENNAVFSGEMETFHDSTRLQATLTGSLSAALDGWCAKISVKFTYHDGSEDNFWRNFTQPWPCGTPASSLSISSDPGKDVVRYRFQSSSLPPQQGAVQFGPMHYDIVGDAPDSSGTCDRLDVDSVSTLPGTYGQLRFNGQSTYQCLTTNGTIKATIAGNLDASSMSSSCPSGRVTATFTYADGSTSSQSSATVQAGGTTSRFVAPSDSSKDVRTASLKTVCMKGLETIWGSTRSTSFGDAS
jgi:hypothetical protein